MHPDKPEECTPCSCRTINLAKQLKPQTKPDMQMYAKCPTPCPRTIDVPELPLHPSCIRVCTKEELMIDRCGKKIPKIKPIPTHGKLIYAVKAGIVSGILYFTHKQGIWGNQRDTTECIARWKAYIGSINSRRPPQFDDCGNLIAEKGHPGLFPRVYGIYKAIITTCFTGVVEVPQIIKCAYLAYLKEQELKAKEAKEKIKT